MDTDFVPMGELWQRVMLALSRASNTIITANDDEDLYGRVCDAIVADPTLVLAWIGFGRDNFERSVDVVGAAGPAKGLLDGLQLTWSDADVGQGQTGVAIRTGRIQVGNAMADDPRLAPFAAKIRQFGIQSAISIPIRIEGSRNGVLTIASSKLNTFREHEIEQFEWQCQGLAYGIAFHRMRRLSGPNEARLAAIVKSSSDAIIGKDLNGVITSWNGSAERIFGYRPDEALGRHVSFLTPPERLGEVDRLIDRIKAGETITRFETERLTKDRRRLDISLTQSPILDHVGTMIGISTIARDITTLRTAERRVRELTAEIIHISRVSAIGAFSTSLVHELNQPLSAMLNWLEAGRHSLAQDVAGEDGVAARAKGFAFLERARQQTERAADIIRRLRQLVERRPMERAFVPLAAIIEDASDLASIGAKVDNIKVHFDCAATLAPVEVDKIQIQQVVVNLVRNAVEAMQDAPDRNLTVKVRARADGLQQVSIADTGSGISPQIAATLFKPFVTSKADGMGVGLSISRSIIEAHGGRLWAEDNPVGGTIFHFTVATNPAIERIRTRRADDLPG